jgi:hypothetical protein
MRRLTSILRPTFLVASAGAAFLVGELPLWAKQPQSPSPEAAVSSEVRRAHPPKRTSKKIPTVGSTFNKAGSEPRLVVDAHKAFANEPLSLGVSVDSATGHESVLLAGLALGTRLSAGVPVNEASWQLAPRDLNVVYVYVYAPKDFIGIMNTAVNLLSANQRLIESRAVRLEWIVAPTRQTEPEAVNTPAAQPINPEDAVLMERGRDLLKSGDVASARLVFDRLAYAGIADAALALATTYDPRYLAQHNLIGVAGDETKAHSWYQRASELGSIEASRILARINAD